MSGVFGSRFSSFTALLVGGLALAASLAVLTPVPGPVRTGAVLAFALIGPGAAIAGLLRIRAAAPWALVTVTGSITVWVITSEFAAILTWWQPRILLAVLAALCSAATALVWYREHTAAVTACAS